MPSAANAALLKDDQMVFREIGRNAFLAHGWLQKKSALAGRQLATHIRPVEGIETGHSSRAGGISKRPFEIQLQFFILAPLQRLLSLAGLK
jgi:hypothetical protein